MYFPKLSIEKAFLLETRINYTIIHYTDGRSLLVSYTLKRAAELLSLPQNFVRVHRSYIVNKQYIKHITEKPQQTVTLHNGKKLSVARRRVV